eukprot:7304557-Pyramimonas_sp.AAC.1
MATNSEDWASHAAILQRVGRLGHRIVMRVARLRYLPRVLRSAPAGLRVVLDTLWDDKTSW